MVATDEVWRLQRSIDSDSRYFRTMAERGHYRGRGGTRQGIYVMSPGGVLLASVNTLKAPRVLEALKKGLEAWQKLPAEKRRLTSPEVIKAEHRWEQSRPDDGLVLRVCSREVPVGFGAETKRGPWNLDHAWFTRKEARQFLSAEPKVGVTHALPAALVQRIARFHLVDNIIGQPLPFAIQEVAGSTMSTVVTGVEGERILLSINGRTQAVAKGPWLMPGSEFEPKKEYPREVHTKIRGTAAFNMKSGRFESFAIVAHGHCTGFTPYNRFATDRTKKVGIGFSFRLTSKEAGSGVAPAFVGEDYAPWIVQRTGWKRR